MSEVEEQPVFVEETFDCCDGCGQWVWCMCIESDGLWDEETQLCEACWGVIVLGEKGE